MLWTAPPALLRQAESVLQLINARTVAAADSALAGLQGGLGEMVRDIREGVMDLLVELEARLDFDEDLPPMDQEGLQQDVADLQAQIEAALRTAREGSLLRNGLQVAIVGRPNVGKSSLLNSWTRTNRAIVTDIAGTTRDVLEAGLVVSGVPITLLDTAGIRASSDTVEKMGVERSTQAAAAADLVVMVVDGSTGWTEADGDIFRSLWGDGAGSRSCKVRGQALLVVNKCDLSGEGLGGREDRGGGEQGGGKRDRRWEGQRAGLGTQPTCSMYFKCQEALVGLHKVGGETHDCQGSTRREEYQQPC